MEDGLDRYRIGRQIGSGSEGNVHEAWDKKFSDRRVAIKLVPLAGKSDAQVQAILARFDQGANIVGRLNHRDIIQVTDKGVDRASNTAFLVMEFVEGETLKDLLKRGGPRQFRRNIDIMVRTLRALDYCHKQRIWHRDIKPGNLMVGSDGGVKVADFGRARADSDDMSLTDPDQMIGTPLYMSPEQFHGKTPTQATSDIWSCGVVLYEMLTGRWPFEGETWRIVGHKVEHEPVVPPSRMMPDVPATLDAVVLKALNKNPADRFKTAEEFAVALLAALPDEAVVSPPRRFGWRVTVAAAFAGAVPLVLAALYWPAIAGWLMRDTRTAPPPVLSLEQQIAGIPCTTVHAIPRGAPGHYLLHGLIGEGKPRQALEAIIRTAEPGTIDRDIETFPGSPTACHLIDTVRPIMAGANGGGVKVSMVNGEHAIRLHHPFQFDVRMPDFGGLLWVDYLDSAQNMYHFEMDPSGSPIHYDAGETLKLGRMRNDGTFRYNLDDGPFGRDLIVALVASEALPGYVWASTGAGYPEEGDFAVTQLAAAIRAWRQRGAKVSADVIMVETIDH